MTHTMRVTLSDIMECEVEFDFTPPEPQVRYYPDGSGYPGSPAQAHLVSVLVLSVDYEDRVLLRESDPKQFAIFDAIAYDEIDDKWDSIYEERAIEEMSIREEDSAC